MKNKIQELKELKKELDDFVKDALFIKEKFEKAYDDVYKGNQKVKK